MVGIYDALESEEGGVSRLTVKQQENKRKPTFKSGLYTNTLNTYSILAIVGVRERNWPIPIYRC